MKNSWALNGSKKTIMHNGWTENNWLSLKERNALIKLKDIPNVKWGGYKSSTKDCLTAERNVRDQKEYLSASNKKMQPY